MKPRTGSRRFRLLLCLVIGSSIGLTAARIDLSLAPKVSAASSPQDRAAVADAAGGSLTSGPAAASRRRSAASVTFPCTVAGVTDGDTFRCAEQGADGRPLRIRLSGVAAR